MDEPRQVPFHESANRPNLLMGGDRVLVIVSFIVSAIVIFAGLKWWSFLFGGTVLAVLLGVVSRMAKVDPMLREAYVKHIGYKQPFYPAKSSICAPSAVTPKRWRSFRFS